jgi:hypothetical protein
MVLQANPEVPNHYYVQTSLHTQEKHQVKPQHLTPLQLGFHLGVEGGKSSQSCIEVLCKIITENKATNSIYSCKKNHALGYASLAGLRKSSIALFLSESKTSIRVILTNSQERNSCLNCTHHVPVCPGSCLNMTQ